MKSLHARYPFLQSARKAVEAADIGLARVVSQNEDVRTRALNRIETALDSGEIGPPHRRDRVELLSYPAARVLVSLVDEHVLTRKYARAEAFTAYERLQAEFTETTELKSRDRDRLSIGTVLAEFDMTDTTRETADGYAVDVGTYLEYATEERDDEWRLVNRPLAGGEVELSEPELLALVRQAITQRVTDGLPLSVPDAIATHLDDECEQIRERLADLELTRDIDTVVPDLFPPCMTYLLDQVQKGEHLEHHSRFAIATFLTAIGLTTDEIVELFQVNPGFGEEATRYQVDHISGKTSPTEYSPPACSTMQSYGDCINKDDLCEQISHPLAYYEAKLDDAEEEELIDWRDRQSAASES